MSVESTTMKAGANIHTTTARREWWGWFGSMVWLFFMMYGHDNFLLDNLGYEDASMYPFYFMMVFALSISALGWRFGRDPNGLSKIAVYTTPCAIAITAIFAVLPQPLGSVLYVIAPIFMAPAITRRVYGIVFTSRQNNRLTRYMSAICTCVAVFTVWMILDLPNEITFIVPALLSVLAWIGITRSVSIPDEAPATGAFRVPKRTIIMLVCSAVLLYWLSLMSNSIHTFVIAHGDINAEVFFTMLGFLSPIIGFMLYAVISDRKNERMSLFVGMALFMIGVFLAFPIDGPQNTKMIVLALASGIGGIYTEFFVLTIPLFFLINAKRPVFVVSLGVVFNLVFSALNWTVGVWLPESLLVLDVPILVSAGISAVLFNLLVNFIFERYREQTLAAALYAMLHGKEDAEAQTSDEATEEQKMADIGFTEDEIKVAMLLIEGDTSRDIARKLHSTAADTSNKMAAIRKKISGVDDPDPVITAVVKKFGLTRRQTEMLRYIRDGMTNNQIASQLSIEEETVRVHMRNLKKKLSVGNKQEIAEWLSDFGKEQS